MPPPTPTTRTDERRAARTRAVVVPPDGGPVQHAFGERRQCKLGGAQTGGSLALGLHTLPPGGGAPERYLAGDAICIAVSGRLELLVDDVWVSAEPGAVVFLPRGVKHALRNAGDAPSQHWMVTTPSGFELFFDACADVFEDAAAAGAGLDVARILALAAEYRVALRL